MLFQKFNQRDAERSKRRTSGKIIVKSSKIPPEFTQFLSCRENKRRLIELMFETTSNEKEEVLEMLISTQVVLIREDECKMLSISSNDT